MNNVIPKNESLQAVHAAKRHAKGRHLPGITRLKFYAMTRREEIGWAGALAPVAPIDLTGPHPRILWTPERIQRGRAWLDSNQDRKSVV